MATDRTARRAVIRGIAIAWLLSLAFVSAGWVLVQRAGFFDDWSAWQVAALSALLAGFALAAGIGWAARTRHFVSNIDGTRPDPGSPLDLVLRYVTNTAEQLLLFCIACAAMAAAAPDVARSLLPVMAVWFLLARAAFWIGYRRQPLGRAVGFAATFHPTLVLMVVALGSFLR